MRKILFLFMLSAAFLGGYYLRGKPNSPDIFAEAKKVYHRLTTITDRSVKAVNERKYFPALFDTNKKKVDNETADAAGNSPQPLSANTTVHYRSEPIHQPDFPSIRW
ncbi:MAG: hypothetical protein J7L99_00140 [Planctomycetes bacterium]|nr:hypothetical protein [Planctomycetota bacterium]